jgi:hypothetical protein
MYRYVDIHIPLYVNGRIFYIKYSLKGKECERREKMRLLKRTWRDNLHNVFKDVYMGLIK